MAVASLVSTAAPLETPPVVIPGMAPTELSALGELPPATSIKADAEEEQKKEEKKEDEKKSDEKKSDDNADETDQEDDSSDDDFSEVGDDSGFTDELDDEDDDLDEFDDIDEDDFDDNFDDDFEEEVNDDYEIEIDGKGNADYGLTENDGKKDYSAELDDFEDFEKIE